MHTFHPQIPDAARHFSVAGNEGSLSFPDAPSALNLLCGQFLLLQRLQTNRSRWYLCSRNRILRKCIRPHAVSVSYHRRLSPPDIHHPEGSGNPRNGNYQFRYHSLPRRRRTFCHFPQYGQPDNTFRLNKLLRNS